jgi:uncharacterized membrane protein YagU involved in acid resistance
LQTSAKNYSGELFKTILLTGLLAGTLDALAAIINFYVSTGKNPIIVFVYIASGIFGKQAYSYGQSIALAGLFFHYCFAIIFSAFYFLMYPKLKFLQWNKINSAIIYGIFVWCVMNLIVVPWSKTPPLPFKIMHALSAVVILIVCIGIPVSFIASSFYNKRT